MLKRLLRGAPPALADEAWHGAVDDLASLLAHLGNDERERLRALSATFLRKKELVPQHGLDADDALRALIAVQACLPVLNLGLDSYRDWRSVIVYPEAFVARHEVLDDDGVVHCVDETMAGEAWERGPLVLSWHDVLTRGDGFNVVIHECAHKLDMLNGDVNGFPPLHADMDPAWWSRVMQRAYEDVCARVDAGADTALDPYAATSPGEFFAVLSETFFELPRVLRSSYPDAYRQLRLFYRQDPAA